MSPDKIHFSLYRFAFVLSSVLLLTTEFSVQGFCLSDVKRRPDSLLTSVINLHLSSVSLTHLIPTAKNICVCGVCVFSFKVFGILHIFSYPKLVSSYFSLDEKKKIV